MLRRPSKTVILIFLFVAVIAASGGAFMRYVTRATHTSASQLVFAPPFGGRETFTVLVLGEDETFSKKKDVYGRTDTIMVGVVDVKNKRARGLSIPRDSRVQIPGKEGYYKINAASVYGGPQLTAQTVANTLGIPIDYYIKTNISGLKNVVDILGGVEIDVEKNMNYVDRRGKLYINLKKGYRHLDGDKALQYVRFRYDALGDISRIKRQQKFLRALAMRMNAPENWTKLPQAIDQIMKNVDTNFTGKDLLSLARMAKHIPIADIHLDTVPGQPKEINGGSYYVLNMEELPVVVSQAVGFKDPMPTVEVLNGSGISGAAERLAETLRGQGYRVIKTGNAKKLGVAQCSVIARDPANVYAKAVADMLNCEAVPMENESDGDPSIIIILGRNYL